MSKTAFTTQLGGEIRATRIALELKQSDIAGSLGVSVSLVSAWEAGTRTMSAYRYSLVTLYFQKQFRSQKRPRKAKMRADRVEAGVSA